jgi:hypothetical protein
MEALMTGHELAFLALIVGALTLFGGALAWATWADSRDASKHRQQKRS